MTPFEKAIEKLKKGKATVEMAERTKPEKSKEAKKNTTVDLDWSKPSLYITNELNNLVKDANVGDIVYVICQCRVGSITENSYTEGKEIKKTRETRLVIEDMAELS
jgi:hypothetical protein